MNIPKLLMFLGMLIFFGNIYHKITNVFGNICPKITNDFGICPKITNVFGICPKITNVFGIYVPKLLMFLGYMSQSY